MDSNDHDTITYRLSSIDQSLIRAYVRYALCFPNNKGQDDQKFQKEVAENLQKNVKRAITYMPILAGKVYEIDEEGESSSGDGGDSSELASYDEEMEEEQRGRVEARVTLAQVKDFEPTIKVLSEDEFPHTYEALSAEKMPANTLINQALTPLPDSPSGDGNGAAAFAVQANFIKGGVIVCFYLHHSVADLKGLAAFIRHMSISPGVLPGNCLSLEKLKEDISPGVHAGKSLTLEKLKEDASQQNAWRDRLSGSRGIKPDLSQHPEYDVTIRKPLAPAKGTSRVLTFSRDMLDGTKVMVNERYQYMYDEPDTRLSAFDCLAGVLWKAITRARFPASAQMSGKTSRIFIPVDMAKRVDPPLPEGFYGNSVLFSSVDMPLSQLTVPFDISTMAPIARRIREGTASMTDAKARSAIAIINDAEDVKTLNHPNIDFSTDVFITNWAELPVGEETKLGLDLGEPEWTRKVSQNQSAYGCVLLPLKDTPNVWEVMISLSEEAMERLLDDVGLAPFVLHVA
ncbi:hypothetical protein PRZ48_000745 [Zasmidium cellare]|uniref:Trichothecene 3-O-acetyltransferase-like N-terminal domain-containing protein n=1 Tax=Zasmidium cellare TaxID=395010 RepID=A0ABR0F0U2_ZASCE|nr:hypothetical protein PRZ48_000745 [Zasmidium cellare]